MALLADYGIVVLLVGILLWMLISWGSSLAERLTTTYCSIENIKVGKYVNNNGKTYSVTEVNDFDETYWIRLGKVEEQ